MAEILVPILFAAAVFLMLFRRIRRLFVRQKVSIPRFVIRIGLPGTIALLLILLPSSTVQVRVYGVVLGLILALGNVLRTKMERVDQEWYFHPNPAVGVVVVALLVGRLSYRILTTQELTATPVGDPSGRLLVLTLVTYFAAYHVGILGRARILGADPGEPEEEQRKP